MQSASDEHWEAMPALIDAICAIGERLRLPYIAAQSDLGDPEPMSDRQGQPYAVTHFRWIDPDHAYWQDRKLALHSPFLAASRLIAEPFYFAGGLLKTWRPTHLLESVDCLALAERSNIKEAIIAPVHLPRGLLGAIVWCAAEPVGVPALFAQEAAEIQAAATRVVATHIEARRSMRQPVIPQALTRREVQCLRWAAVGKTDSEIGTILSLSVSTVRFHLRNAAGKLGATGRGQSIQIAAGLGYIGGRSG